MKISCKYNLFDDLLKDKYAYMDIACMSHMIQIHTHTHTYV